MALLAALSPTLYKCPVASFTTGHVPPKVPQVLINREPLRHKTFDVELLGDCDVIISELCQRLGGSWNSLNDFKVPYVERGVSSPDKVNMTLEERPKDGESKVSGTLDGDQVRCI